MPEVRQGVFGKIARLMGVGALCLSSFSAFGLAAEDPRERTHLRASIGGIEVSLPIFRGVSVDLLEQEVHIAGRQQDLREAYLKLDEEVARHPGVVPIRGYGFYPKDLCELAKIPECKYIKPAPSAVIASLRYAKLWSKLTYKVSGAYGSICGHDIKWIYIDGITNTAKSKMYILPGTMDSMSLLVDDVLHVRVTVSNFHGGFKGAETEKVMRDAAEFAACVLSYNAAEE